MRISYTQGGDDVNLLLLSMVSICRRHVVRHKLCPTTWRRQILTSAQVVSDVSVVRICWSIRSLRPESNNTNMLLIAVGYTWNVYFA